MNFGWAPEWNLAFMLRVEEVLGFSLASQLGQSNITDEISWRNQSGFDGENASKKKKKKKKRRRRKRWDRYSTRSSYQDEGKESVELE